MLLGAVCVIDTPGFITGFLSFKNFETLSNGKMKVIVIVTYDRESWGKILNMSPSRPMLCSSRAGIQYTYAEAPQVGFCLHAGNAPTEVGLLDLDAFSTRSISTLSCRCSG